MKQGRSLTDMARELERQQNAKRDFIADTRRMFMASNNLLGLEIQDGGVFTAETNRHAHTQIANWAKIPQQYYDRMPPELRAINVNHWFREQPAQRMVRTLDGEARAFLSNRYRCLDNFDLAETVLPVLMEQPDMQVVSCELTDRRMYIKALFPRVQREVAKGDLVQSGIVISNSEIGQGSLAVEPLVYRLVCTNGMISNVGNRRHHVGRANDAEGESYEFFRDETLQADDRAFWLKVQDIVRASIDEAAFARIVQKMADTKQLQITGDPVLVCERVQKRYGLNDGERGSVLSHLISGGDLSGYGLLNAITRSSQDVEDYDRATELERIGGKIIELDRTQWSELAQAA